MDGLNYKEFLGNYEPTIIDKRLEFIHFYHNIIVIKKKHKGKEVSICKEW